MFCSKCGSQQPDGSAFCSDCGENLLKYQLPVTPIPETPTPTEPIPAPPPAIEVPISAPSFEQKPKKKGPKWWLILIIVILVVAIVGGAAYFAVEYLNGNTVSESSEDDDGDSNTNSSSDSSVGTPSGDPSDTSSQIAPGTPRITFAKDSYEVKVGGYVMVSEGIVIEPANTNVIYEISNMEIALISKRGEVYGFKEGTVTVTARSEDGKLWDTCTVVVKNPGSVAARDADGFGGITNKRYNAPERPDDTNAIVVIISKDIDKSVDKTAITTLNYGTMNSDGYYVVSGEGFYVTRTNDKGNYLLEGVPSGEYVGLIISSKDYTQYKTYDNSTIAPTLKASKLNKVLSNVELDAIARCSAIQSREYFVSEFSVRAEETTVFGHAFAID